MRQFLFKLDQDILRKNTQRFSNLTNQLGFIKMGLNNRPSFKLSKPQFNKKLLYGVLALVIAIGVVYLISNNSNFSTSKATADVSTNKATVEGAKKSAQLGREFEFPIKDQKGKAVTQFKYVIENAELRDEIITKGKRATSVAGRTFLVINLKLVNDFNQSMAIKPEDYLRLSVNGNESEWLAPYLNDEPVTVQPISTKFTKLVFPINEADTTLKLRVGEIESTKTDINITF